MHQSPVRSPPRGGMHGGFAAANTDTAYTNGKSGKKPGDGRMTAVIVVFGFVILLFGSLVYQVLAISNDATAAEKRRSDRLVADEVFWRDLLGRGRPFVDVIPNTQFTVERGHALAYTSTHNIKDCAEKCLADDKCGAFSFVKPHTKVERLDNWRSNRCILIDGHYSTVKFDEGMIVRRDPVVVRKLREARIEAADVAAAKANNVFSNGDAAQVSA